MTEEVLFKTEQKLSNQEIANHLKSIAKKIEKRRPITLESGEQKVSLDTDRTAEFEVKVEREHDEESLELEIEWENKKPENVKIN